MNFKEISCIKYKKNKCEHNTQKVAELLQDKNYEIKTFQVDEGVTVDDVQFITHRFYIKKK